MKQFNRFLFSALLLSTGLISSAQVILPQYPEASFSTYYWQKVSQFDVLPTAKGSTLFIGDSITDGGEWATLFNDPSIINIGISSDISAGLINRVRSVLKHQPAKVFIMIGVNDLSKNVSVDSLSNNISLIAKYIKQELPSTAVFVQSILPVNNSFKSFAGHTDKTDAIIKLNGLLQANAKNLNYTFINLYSSFCNAEGKLNADFTNDGVHLKGAGYALWKHLNYPYVKGLQETPSIIPKPTEIIEGKGLFPLYQVKYVYYAVDSLKNEAMILQKILAQSGHQVGISNKIINQNEPDIQLQINGSAKQKNEAYQLSASTKKILIQANAKAGIFYGVQTLKQLARDGYYINAVNIRDEPAFVWRSYMVDVGRNYQSIALLKQQIDVMAAYKLNVFHMHLTEDIAWRIAIKQYPELTDPKFMERNKGMYYTTAEIKDLINYCKERQILFVPEIDMPGHSAAFKRALKVDMQSDSGLLIVKNIVKELIDTYQFPYLHIGADEVKIHNQKFLPEISALLKSLNVKIVGWEPGGNFDESTIRHLWMDEAGVIGNKTKIKYIDSRHLYINHMDPLESVVTIFNRQLANVNTGNNEALGATLCSWPDRAVATENDVLRMNAVYPSMLAFAERSWLGNGYPGWVATMDLNGNEAFESFKAFESRLMDHKKQYFKDLIFPYQKQSDVEWKLYGPYQNEGDLSKQFEPEKSSFNLDLVKANQTATGGTIILRHWWAPKIKSAITDPKENTTWYATRKIWSDQDTTRNFWISFYNISKSQATDSPPVGKWDKHDSAIWLNNELVNPPLWLRGGQKGNLEIPLVDESYELRPGMPLKLKKGWNTVKIKAPIGSFNGKDWNNPEKWMFTFIEETN